MKSALVVALLAFSACTSSGLSEGDLLAQAPVVNRAPGEVDTLSEEEARRGLAAAEEAYAQGDDRECLRIVRETLDCSPPEAVATALRALRLSAKRRLISREVVDGRVVPRLDLVSVGASVEADLVIRNLSDVPLTVAASDSGASDTVFVIDVETRAVDIYGSVKVETARHLVPVADDLEVPPGGRVSVLLTLPTGRPEDRHLGFSVLRLSGSLRPAVIRAGEERYYEGLVLRDAVVRVLPTGWEPIGTDPLGTLRKALALRAREHVLLAAELCPPENRGAAAAALGAYLLGETTPGMERTVVVALGRLTGLPIGDDPGAWAKWTREGGPDGLR